MAGSSRKRAGGSAALYGVEFLQADLRPDATGIHAGPWSAEELTWGPARAFAAGPSRATGPCPSPRSSSPGGRPEQDSRPGSRACLRHGRQSRTGRLLRSPSPTPAPECLSSMKGREPCARKRRLGDQRHQKVFITQWMGNPPTWHVVRGRSFRRGTGARHARPGELRRRAPGNQGPAHGQRRRKKMGIRATRTTAEVLLEDVTIPAENVLGGRREARGKGPWLGRSAFAKGTQLALVGRASRPSSCRVRIGRRAGRSGNRCAPWRTFDVSRSPTRRVSGSKFGPRAHRERSDRLPCSGGPHGDRESRPPRSALIWRALWEGRKRRRVQEGPRARWRSLKAGRGRPVKVTEAGDPRSAAGVRLPFATSRSEKVAPPTAKIYTLFEGQRARSSAIVISRALAKETRHGGFAPGRPAAAEMQG